MSENKSNTTMLGNSIRSKRESLGMTRQALADELNVSESTVSGWENDGKIPKIDLWPGLIRFLGINSDQMLAYALNGDIPDENSPEELFQRLNHSGKSPAQWSRSLSGKILDHAIGKDSPHNRCAEIFLSSLLMYISNEAAGHTIGFTEVLGLAMESEISERNEYLESSLDRKFAELERKDKSQPAVICYKTWGNYPSKGKKVSIALVSDALLLLSEWEKEAHPDAAKEYYAYKEERAKDNLKKSGQTTKHSTSVFGWRKDGGEIPDKSDPAISESIPEGQETAEQKCEPEDVPDTIKETTEPVSKSSLKRETEIMNAFFSAWK